MDPESGKVHSVVIGGEPVSSARDRTKAQAHGTANHAPSEATNDRAGGKTGDGSRPVAGEETTIDQLQRIVRKLVEPFWCILNFNTLNVIHQLCASNKT